MSQKIYLYKVLTEESRKEGRPNKYNDNYHPKAAFEIMKLGATKAKCADILGIRRETIWDWERRFEEFSNAITQGRDAFLSDDLEGALHKRAKGFRYTERTFERPQPNISFTVSDKMDPSEAEERKDQIIKMLSFWKPVLTKEVKKFYPPDVAALKYYLGNRDPERWPKNGDIPGEGSFMFFTRADVEKMLAEEKDVLSKLPPLPEKGEQDDQEGEIPESKRSK
jgi:hypothetical protein